MALGCTVNLPNRLKSGGGENVNAPADDLRNLRGTTEQKTAAFKEQLKNLNFWGKKIGQEAQNLKFDIPEAEHTEYIAEPPTRLIFDDESASEVNRMRVRFTGTKSEWELNLILIFW